VDGQVDFSACKFIELELGDSLRIGFAREGDVLLTHKGTIGRIGMVQVNRFPYIMLTPQVTYYRCREQIHNRFLFWSMQGAYWQDQMVLISGQGTTRAYVGLLDQKRLMLLLPPTAEQVAIAAFLDAETATIDSLIRKVEAAIDRLVEYCRALVTSAVAGKIDLRKATA
jgi:type I restriction enzyme, S subunit